jgi:hypothetical protein
MAIFNRIVTKAAVSPPPAKAAASGGSVSQALASYYNFTEGEARNRCMSVPTISRARDLIASVIGCMSLRMYNEVWNELDEEMMQIHIAPRSWLRRIDPAVPNNFILSWTFDDLFFYGRAMWYITSRTADGYPASFQRLPMGSISTTDMVGPVWFGPSKEIYFNGNQLDPNNVVQFLSPIQGITSMSTQSVGTALKLEAARYRNSASSIPAGVLKQTGGEPLSGQELADLASAFNAARATNQTAALNEYLTYTETATSPDKMLLIDSAEFQAKEMARICNVPFYLVGCDVGSYSYVSNDGARADLWTFGAKAYAECITSTLSQNNVLPNGTYVEFDYEDYLSTEYGQMQMPEVTTPMGVTSPS